MTKLEILAVGALLAAGWINVSHATDAKQVEQAAKSEMTVTQTAEEKIIEVFNRLDTDANGELSKEEASPDAMLSKQFAALDTDANGGLSITEYAKHKL